MAKIRSHQLFNKKQTSWIRFRSVIADKSGFPKIQKSRNPKIQKSQVLPSNYFCSMDKKVRVRFAPSPTGGLHLGGVRTVLYNYLFARKHGGAFVLRIEDTDQSRFVPGAEEYIMETLRWCGMEPDESPGKGGPFGPYRQSERKHLYHQYAQTLIDKGLAYYAFDTAQELDEMRLRMRSDTNTNPQYDHTLRAGMRNSLSLPQEETKKLLDEGTPYVIRIKMMPGETIRFTDMIRGEVSFETSVLDDKVLLKADGMPTYHLAVVVDDHLMQISHAFRGLYHNLEERGKRNDCAPKVR